MSIISPHNIEWLLVDYPEKSETQLVSNAEKFRAEIPYPPELAKGFTEHSHLRNGVVFIQDEHVFASPGLPPEIQLGRFNYKSVDHEPMFCIHDLHSGRIKIKDTHTKKEVLRSFGTSFFGRAVEYSIEQVVLTSENISGSCMLMPEKLLYELIGKNLAEELFSKLNIPKINDYNLIKTPSSMRNLIKECASNKLQRTFYELSTQSRLLEYLVKLLDLTDTKQGGSPDDSLALEIYNHIVKSKEESPSLKSLAKIFEQPAQKLNSIFQNVYEESIYSFVTKHKLEQAHMAIESGAVPLKIVADRIGYSHVNHFIYAFKKQFGYTPGSLRKTKI
jgi:AraC-like DNA-binding protein